jgi:surface polysaccharide O-acyltransferase-like enzyme
MIAFGVEQKQNYDFLRVTGSLAVIMIHLCAKVINNYQIFPHETVAVAVVLSALSRWAVPLFIMVSGAIFLGGGYTWVRKRVFYKKRLGKIFWPFVFWNLIYWLVFGGSWQEGLQSLWIYSQTYYHLYYLPVAMGLYAITPVLRKLNLKITTMVGMAGATIYIAGYYLGWWQKIEYLPVIFVPYLGLYCLGGWLAKVEAKIGWIGLVVVLGLLMTGVTMETLYQYGATDGGQVAFDRLWPWVGLQAVAVFLVFKNYGFGKGGGLVNKLAELSLGVYLIHPLITDKLFFQPVSFNGWTYVVCWIMSRLLLTVLLAGGLTWLMKRLAITRGLVGG